MPDILRTICLGSLAFAAPLSNVAIADAPPTRILSIVREYCIDCHRADDAAGGVDLVSVLNAPVPDNAVLWERALRKLRTRQMPPLAAPRPSLEQFDFLQRGLESELDRVAEESPHPGRTESLRRMNRTEYRNVIRDLLELDVDVAALLPADELSHGFDNVTVTELSPTLLNRYITAAQFVSRLAVGGQRQSPGGDTLRIPGDVTQEEHIPGLPLGTRGGTLIPYTFPRDGEYEIQIRLARDRNEEVEGLSRPHELDVLLGKRRVTTFTVAPPRDRNHSLVDAHLKARFFVKAGPQTLGVTFQKNPTDLLETRRQPWQAHFNMHRHPRWSPAIYQVSITGPWTSDGPGDTPSRRRLFVARPESASSEDEAACARQIFSTVMRRAYRRPVTAADFDKPLRFYDAARQTGDFEAGIQSGLTAILVSPDFLFRIEREPESVAPGTPYRISDLELASRLSFFLWSSLPDDELLGLAERERLSDAEVLKQQALRLLRDPRSQSLVTSFAAQWLYLRNLDSITPDLRLFPDFDDNLRQAFRQETELFFESVLREDRSVLDLLRSDDSFLNERLAAHYGIPHVHGSRFRRVRLDASSHRGGLLRHGSILTVTSYATRTSPVIRGHWILKNLLSAAPPPPPPDVPALTDNSVTANLPLRTRLAQHRENPACASCHDLMDPIGFALENFDAVGRWRTTDAGQPLDVTGTFPDGSPFSGVSGLEETLLRHPDLFVTALTEKLLTYALGRGVETHDAPAIRKIVRSATRSEYRFSELILGVVNSPAFQMRETAGSEGTLINANKR